MENVFGGRSAYISYIFVYNVLKRHLQLLDFTHSIIHIYGEVMIYMFYFLFLIKGISKLPFVEEERLISETKELESDLLVLHFILLNFSNFMLYRDSKRFSNFI
jgi:hypothetical protein